MYLVVIPGDGVQLKDRGQMTYEERLEAAERHRLTGNALFQEACTRLCHHAHLALHCPGWLVAAQAGMPVHHPCLQAESCNTAW